MTRFVTDGDSDRLGGLYIHIPFCVKKCIYCDFYSTIDLGKISRFLDALQREIKLAANCRLTFDSLYIGGGTPSVLDPGDIGCIVESVLGQFDVLPDAEITLEVNPGTLSPEKLEAYRQGGINRLNIGVQSFQNDNLEFLGRIHSGYQAHETIQWAHQTGFDNIGLDLIYGLPGQDPGQWIADLEQAVALAPEHLSCYMLTRESGTPLDREIKAGRLRLPTGHTMRKLFDITIDFLTAHGFYHYEISNFARLSENGRCPWMSRHNRKYWSADPYLGLGPSAHSFIQPRRWWNYSSVSEYVRKIAAGQLPLAGEETLTREQRMLEVIYLGLRTKEGIDLRAFERNFGLTFDKVYKEELGQLQNEGLLELTPTQCRLTRDGMAFHEAVAAMLTGR